MICLLVFHHLVESCGLDNPSEYTFRQCDHSFIVFGTIIIVWTSRQRICTIFLSSNMSKFEGEVSHEADSSCHPPVDLLRLAIILQVLMVCPDDYFVRGADEEVSPMFQSNNHGQEFSIPNVIVSLRRI